MKTKSLFVLVCLLTACGAPQPTPCGASYVDASLSSATLAHDCPNATAAKDSPGICLAPPCADLSRALLGGGSR